MKNSKPPGIIETAGNFGPWQRDDPRSTSVSGDYTFRHADLFVFKGISGTLSSDGKYAGIVQHIRIDGNTDTPDFSLKKSGAPVHLVSRFHAVVDGTNGDTILDPVDARFGQSEFICRGGVVHHAGQPGKAVELDAHTKYGRMEDILTLIVDEPPVLKGEVAFQSKIVIPPGPARVVDKLKLNGEFQLESAVFTSAKAGERLQTLSTRASGISKAESEQGQGNHGPIASEMSARFQLDNGQVSFLALPSPYPALTFNWREFII